MSLIKPRSYNGASNGLEMIFMGQEVGKIGQLNPTCCWYLFRGKLDSLTSLCTSPDHNEVSQHSWNSLLNQRLYDSAILETFWALNLHLVLRLPSSWAELHISTHSPSSSTWAEGIRLAGIFNKWWCFQVKKSINVKKMSFVPQAYYILKVW